MHATVSLRVSVNGRSRASNKRRVRPGRPVFSTERVAIDAAERTRTLWLEWQRRCAAHSALFGEIEALSKAYPGPHQPAGIDARIRYLERAATELVGLAMVVKAELRKAIRFQRRVQGRPSRRNRRNGLAD